MNTRSRPTIGVLALQGAFDSHIRTLADLGVHAVEIRTPSQLDGIDALIMPGGESTTMSKLVHSTGLDEPLTARLHAGMAVFGTCAGMILLATEVLDGRPDQTSFGMIDLAVRRNGYGRQVDSFEDDVLVEGLDAPYHAVFIRAPRVESVGPAVTVLARHGDDPVLARQGNVLVAAFHPEITDDPRLHQLFLTIVESAPAAA